jgi:hypothetical protein
MLFLHIIINLYENKRSIISRVINKPYKKDLSAINKDLDTQRIGCGPRSPHLIKVTYDTQRIGCGPRSPHLIKVTYDTQRIGRGPRSPHYIKIIYDTQRIGCGPRSPHIIKVNSDCQKIGCGPKSPHFLNKEKGIGSLLLHKIHKDGKIVNTNYKKPEQLIKGTPSYKYHLSRGATYKLYIQESHRTIYMGFPVLKNFSKYNNNG